MTIETFMEPEDDPEFLACVDRIIAGLVERHAPEDVSLVRIANWFDHKWLRYSGYGCVPFHGVSIHTALHEFRQEQLTFPPFTPKRVVTQHYFCRTTRGDYQEQAPGRLVHRAGLRHSAENLQRRVADFSRSAVYVWFSSRSRPNGRGSLMIYTVDSGWIGAWYAAFWTDASWQLGPVKGINRSEVEAYLAGPHPTAVAPSPDPRGRFDE